MYINIKFLLAFNYSLRWYTVYAWKWLPFFRYALDENLRVLVLDAWKEGGLILDDKISKHINDRNPSKLH